MREQAFYMDFDCPQIISAFAYGEVLMKCLLKKHFVLNTKYLQARWKDNLIEYPISLGDPAQLAQHDLIWHVTISHDILKLEENRYQVVSDRVIGEGAYGETVACVLELVVSPSHRIQFKPANYIIKSIKKNHDDFIETEVKLNNVYRLGDKGERAQLIPAGAGENDKAIIVMPRRAGKDLDKWNIAEMALEERLYIVDSIVSELIDLHSKQVIHRDLKESNIVYEGNFGAVSLVDLGLATYASRSHTHNLVGTPGYRPPEVVNTFTPIIGQAVDIYALGPIFANLLGAKNPLLKRNEWHSKYDNHKMATAPIILDGIFKDYSLPPYFEEFTQRWLDLLNQTGRENPRERPSLEEFKKLIEDFNFKKNLCLNNMGIINPLFLSIKFLFTCEFLQGAPSVKAFSSENFDSLISLFPKFPEQLNETFLPLQRRKPSFFSSKSFVTETGKIINQVLLTFPMLRQAMLGYQVNPEQLRNTLELLQKSINFVMRIEATWSKSFRNALGNYIHGRTTKDFGKIHQIIWEVQAPIFVKLDLIITEAKKLIDSEGRPDGLLYLLALLGNSIGNQNYEDILDQIDVCIQEPIEKKTELSRPLW